MFHSHGEDSQVWKSLFATHNLNRQKDDDLIQENRQVLQWKN